MLVRSGDAGALGAAAGDAGGTGLRETIWQPLINIHLIYDLVVPPSLIPQRKHMSSKKSILGMCVRVYLYKSQNGNNPNAHFFQGSPQAFPC